MEVTRSTFVSLAIAAIIAAGGGAYIATRQFVAQAPGVTAEEAAAKGAAQPGAVNAQPVSTETEATLVEDPQPASPSELAAPPITPKPVGQPSSARSRAASTGRGTTGRRTAGTQTTSPSTSSAPPWQGLDRPWPSREPDATTNSAGSASAPPVEPPAAAAVPDPPVRTEEPIRLFDELVVSSDSVIGLQVDTAVDSERARVEDVVEARVTRDVKVGDRVAIPSGARAVGSVTLVERGGKFRDRPRLGVRFHTLALADGTRLALQTETIYREGDAPGPKSAAKVGGAAIGGAVLGAILGGRKGAVIGSTVGAAGGTAAVAAGDRTTAVLPGGSTVTVRLLAPVTVTVERN